MVGVTNGILFYTAGQGEQNHVTVTLSGGMYAVMDPGATMTGFVGSPCTISPDGHEADCPEMGIASLRVFLGDLNDDVTISAPTPARLLGGEGDDSLTGGSGNDRLNGGAGNDSEDGGSGTDLLGASDLLLAPGSQDPGLTDPGNDSLRGGAGDDTALFVGTGDGADDFSGGDGRDRVDYSDRATDVRVTLDGSADDGGAGEGDDIEPDVEDVTAGSGSDTLTGSGAENSLDGGKGDDLIEGGGGSDVLDGGANDAGNDTLSGGDGNDMVHGQSGDDLLKGDAGDDGLNGGGGTDTVEGGDGADSLAGGAGIDTVEGGAGDDSLLGGDVALIGADSNDTLSGGEGKDTLDGGPGDDALDGGAGADDIRGGEGNDTATYDQRTATVSLSLDGLANDGQPLEADNIEPDVENATGGGSQDDLTGNAELNKLGGGGGEDYLDGAGGRDELSGGRDADVLRARDGLTDVVDCGPARDFAIVDPGDLVKDSCEIADTGVGNQPVFGDSVVILPSAGILKIRLSQLHRFVPLLDRINLPLSSTVDATSGAVLLKARARRRGPIASGTFNMGAFLVKQPRRARGLTELTLTGGDFSACRAAARTGASSARRHAVRRLFGNTHGRFRTRGRHSTATVRGTVWLTVDRCDGTLTKVHKGVVRVHDLALRRDVLVKAGHSYLARARPR